MRAAVAIIVGLGALSAMTLAGHFASTTQGQPHAAPSGLRFSEFDLHRFDAAMAEGAAMIVHLPDPTRPERLAFTPDGVTSLALEPAVCPGVAASLEAWRRGEVLAFHGGAEVGRVAARAPDGAVDALLRRLQAMSADAPRSAPGAQP